MPPVAQRPQPGLGEEVFDAFVEAKRVYLEALSSGAIDKPTEIDRLHQRVMAITGDPLPYGIAPNRRVLEDLIRHAHTQCIITRRVAPEELFPASTHGFVG